MIGERIKAVRQAITIDGRKPSQDTFGARLGVTRDAIANIETGRVEQPPDTLIKYLCQVFNVSETWLRTGEGEMFVQLTRDEEIAAFLGDVLSTEEDTFQKRFLSMLSELKESDWEVLERMAEALKKD